MRLCPRDDAHPVLFAAYVALLERLATDAEPALRAFERSLLEELGYGLRLPEDLDPGWHYRYDWEQGPLPARAGDAEAYSGASLIALRDDRLDAADLRRDARRLLRQALQRQLGGRPLETARLLRELRGLVAGPAVPEP